MFFQSLLPLINSGVKLNIVLEAANGGQITVGILPSRTDDSKSSEVLVPCAFTGTAQELDQQFPTQVIPALTNFTQSLAEQIDAARTVAEAQAEEANKKTVEKPRPAKARRPASSSPSGLVDSEEDSEGQDDDDGPSESPSGATPAKSGADTLTMPMPFGL